MATTTRKRGRVGGGKRETLYEGEHLALKRRGSWEYAERTGSRAGVMIVAVTPDERLVLVEERRPPVGADVISLPAGLVGDEDARETSKQAAARELVEETGYAAAKLRELGGGPTSPGLSSEMLTFFLARDARRIGDPNEEEGTTVHVVALSKLFSWTSARRRKGVLIHPMLWAGLCLAGLCVAHRLLPSDANEKKEKR